MSRYYGGRPDHYDYDEYVDCPEGVFLQERVGYPEGYYESPEGFGYGGRMPEGFGQDTMKMEGRFQEDTSRCKSIALREAAWGILVNGSKARGYPYDGSFELEVGFGVCSRSIQPSG